MKILITTDLFTTETNGVVTSVKNLWDELKKRGHDVKILTLSENVHSHRDGDVYYIRSMPFGIYPDIRMPLTFRHKLIDEIVEWKPEIVHSQCEFFTYQFAKHISKLTQAPVVHTYHTLYEQYATYLIPSKKLGAKVVEVISRKRLKNAETIIAPTRKVEATLLEYGMKNHICVIPSGISMEQHAKRLMPEERAAKRHALGIADDVKVLINLGRLGTEKNLEELMRFHAKAVGKNDRLLFLIVGDGPAREDLEKLAKELRIEKNVLFTGMVKPSEVQDYYQIADVFVSASTSETQGLTYIEAAANGLPLLCRQDLCLQDVIKQGENGYEYENIEQYLDCLDNIFTHPEWIKAAGKVSEKIAQSFDKHTFGEAVERMYMSVINEPHYSEKPDKNAVADANR